jgi:hypothetical protein
MTRWTKSATVAPSGDGGVVSVPERRLIRNPPTNPTISVPIAMNTMTASVTRQS